jgi:hypothetical protein
MKSQQMEKDKKQQQTNGANADRQGVDKVPEQEKGKSEQVTDYDLKAKKVDADPEDENQKPGSENK